MRKWAGAMLAGLSVVAFGVGVRGRDTLEGSEFYYLLVFAGLSVGLVLFFGRPAIKVIPWMAVLVTPLLLGGWIVFGVLLGGVDIYTYGVSYPAAVYAEDGSKIVFLEHRSISRHNKLGTGPTHSKTYLGVMDKDGRGKRMVGEASGVIYPGNERIGLARWGQRRHKILESYGGTASPEGSHPNDVVDNEQDIVIAISPRFTSQVVGTFRYHKGKRENYSVVHESLKWSADGQSLYFQTVRQYETNEEKPNPSRPGETYKVWKQEPKMWYLDIRTGEVVVVQQESARIVENRSALSDLLKIIPDAYTLYPINDPRAVVHAPHQGGSSYFFRPPWWKL